MPTIHILLVYVFDIFFFYLLPVLQGNEALSRQIEVPCTVTSESATSSTCKEVTGRKRNPKGKKREAHVSVVYFFHVPEIYDYE